MSELGFSFVRDPVIRDLARLSSALDTIANADRKSDISAAFFGGKFNAFMDLSETDKEYILHADIPGVKKDDIDISIKENVLTIAGERSTNKEIKDDQRHLVERAYGKFARSLRLPNNANADKVAASFDNGVLQLVFPKKPLDDGVKKISIN
ncbi:hypothetical protein HDU83_000400 [Entophlyctis luteolus]|nr:hypothetical protein HDU83_000400 [Entophlyctis luteolus]